MLKKNQTSVSPSEIQKTLPSTTQKKRREAGIEILRFLLIMTIIFLHIQYQTGGWKLAIAVPTFFAISGWFTVRSNKSRFLKFFCQFIIYIILGLIIQGCFYYYGNINLNFNPFAEFMNFHCLSDNIVSWWFLYAMLFLTLVTPYLNKFIQWNKQFSFWAIIFLIAILNCLQDLDEVVKHQYDMLSPWKIMIAISYYCAGGWVSYYWGDSIKKYKWYVLPACAIFVVLYVLIARYYTDLETTWFKNTGCELINVQTSDPCVLHYIAAVSLIILFDALPGFIQRNRFLPFLGKLPLFIYLFHGLVILSMWHFAPNIATGSAAFYFSVLGITTLASAIFAYPIEKAAWYMNYVITNKTFKLNKKVG